MSLLAGLQLVNRFLHWSGVENPETLDENFMRQALVEARRALGRTSPNPAVGAVFVRRGRVVARGFHRGAGREHAEVECLRKVRDASNGSLYVTLEPCSTRGRTGPCTDYLIGRRVARVVIGAVDPNPKHKGNAIGLLRRHGIAVVTGVLETECTQLNGPFNKWISTGVPWVIAKCAMSLDGYLTRPPSEPRWLSSKQSRADAHKLRASVDAIMVGAETIRRDDPRLTVRGLSRRRVQPWRVVLSRSGRLPPAAKILRDESRTLIFRRQSLADVLRDLGGRKITSVLVEGGGEILSVALAERLIDQVQLYLAPIMTGGGVLAFGGEGAGSTAFALRFTRVSYTRIGSDVRISGFVDRDRIEESGKLRPIASV